MLKGEWKALGENCALLLVVVTGDGKKFEWKIRKTEMKQFLGDS